LFGVGPEDERFVEETNHGFWVTVGNVYRQMGNSREVQICF